MPEFQKRPPFITITKIILTASLMTSISNGNLLAAECEISGINLLQAYSRAVNNDAGFACGGGRGATFLPLPTGLQCFHKKTRKGGNASRRTYTMISFTHVSPWPLNDWKISRYQMIGHGRKISNYSGAIIYKSERSTTKKWYITLKRIWLKKAGGSCSNINTVIREAFGK